MWGIVGDIVKGLVSGIIEGVSASNEKEVEKISDKIVALLRTGADAVEAARSSFKSEDAQTLAAFAEARRRLGMHLMGSPITASVATLMPPADDETTKP